ncbi:multiple sugar transport system permease protein [Crossiella equi]|uniref:Multiple sugar transport system permease protein n=1 Tax=Crossiella equi TaxID=130796 RepID=A0ABS5AQ57_9PSEU|nr:sugar ABC transporter permease [Crossiella equi]MBP2478382.1 multiple sugar transport system permease protein [Crossiella equi]
MASTRRRQAVAGYAFFTPFLLVFAATVVLPLGYAAYLSLFRDRLVGGRVFAGLDNYAAAFTDPLFGEGLLRVAGFLAVQVPLMLGLAVLAALAIDSGRLWRPGLFRVGVFIPYAVPGVVAALMWGYLYGTQFGVLDLLTGSWLLAAIGNVVTWEYVGYNMLICYAALRAIPPELYEAAEVDGAGPIRKAWSIKLPALRPALLVATVFSVIGSFQLFNEPSIFQALAPAEIGTAYTPNLYAYNLAFNGLRFDYSSAIAVVLGLVTVVIAYAVHTITERRERQG